ncbi:MAG: response regulator transcription factor [Sulfurovum sp.]|nr:response regulator transcription factor [Sulfurovum sp.]NNJ46144.1 response regulator transcription factor [Sulfurovum sp.]
MKKILLLEDDIVLRETVEDELHEANYTVEVAIHGEAVLDLTLKNRYDLYIFDINVPYIDGVTLLKELRESGDNTPAIFLTSRSEEPDIIRGFQIGCDDYVVKPFSILELKLRIDAILKRTVKKKTICFEDIELDLKNNYLSINSQSVEVHQKTAELLHFFISHPGQTFSFDDIINNLYHEKIPSHTVIRVHISHINALFEQRRIINIRGIGYRYENK